MSQPIFAFESGMASYASKPSATRGRKFAEAEDPARSPHQRDRDRIIHSAAFRRLEYKTQVFVNHEGDHYRTRLTHSLEVSQLARSISRHLGLNEDLAEALALAHDLGHTPFGHAGEDGLNEAMKDYGGFDHNAQTIRILTRLEARYASFDGLNLTWETLEGVAKHNGPVANPPRALASYNKEWDLELATHAGLEAQIAALADDIAYNNHDVEDGLRAQFFTLDELEALPLVGDLLRDVRQQFPHISKQRQTHEFVRRMINRMVSDLFAQIGANLKNSGVQTVEDVRALGRPIAHFSKEMQEVHLSLKRFLMQRMYRHYRINRMTSKAQRVVAELFRFFMEEPNCLPTHWHEAAKDQDQQGRAETIADFIAGMTDRFALEEHARIFDPLAKT